MMSRSLSVGLVGVAVLAMSATAEAGTVRGQGRVVYSQNGANGGTTLPLAGARVHLIDDDGLVGDDTLKTGYTDANGNFDLTGSDTDCWGCGKLDPYILVELEGSGGKIVVESEVLKVNVTCATSVRDNTEGTINFGTLACGGTTGKDAGALFGHLQKAYGTFTQLTGQSTIPRHSGKAAALFPVVLAAGVPYTTEESIHWPGGFRDFGAVYHEFGHRIRHAQDGDFTHFLGDVAKYSYLQQHWRDKLTNEGFAFNEGWAEYNATLSDPDEAKVFANWNTSSFNNGSNAVEGNVAARLTRLSRDCGGFKRLWSTLQSGSFHTYNQFASKLKADFQASSVLRSQFPQCISSAIASVDTATPSAWDHDHDHAPLVLAQNDHEYGVLLGALAPTGRSAAEAKTAVADQSAQLSRMGDEIKAQVARTKSRNTLAGFAKLKPLGDKLASDRDDFERRAATKLDHHVKGLKAHDGSKAAIEKRQAENAAFVKDVVQDRVTTLEAHLASVKAEQAKTPTGSEAQALAQLRAKLEKVIVDLKEAARTGNVEQRHLPRGFSLPAEATP